MCGLFFPPIICNTHFLIGNFFVQHSNKHFAFKFCLSSLTQGCWNPVAKMPMASPNEQLEGLGLFSSLLLGARSVHAYTEHSLQDKRATEQLTANETNGRRGCSLAPPPQGSRLSQGLWKKWIPSTTKGASGVTGHCLPLAALQAPDWLPPALIPHSAFLHQATFSSLGELFCLIPTYKVKMKRQNLSNERKRKMTRKKSQRKRR